MLSNVPTGTIPMIPSHHSLSSGSAAGHGDAACTKRGARFSASLHATQGVSTIEEGAVHMTYAREADSVGHGANGGTQSALQSIPSSRSYDGRIHTVGRRSVRSSMSDSNTAGPGQISRSTSGSGPQLWRPRLSQSERSTPINRRRQVPEAGMAPSAVAAAVTAVTSSMHASFPRLTRTASIGPRTHLLLGVSLPFLRELVASESRWPWPWPVASAVSARVLPACHLLDRRCAIVLPSRALLSYFPSRALAHASLRRPHFRDHDCASGCARPQTHARERPFVLRAGAEAQGRRGAAAGWQRDAFCAWRHRFAAPRRARLVLRCAAV